MDDNELFASAWLKWGRAIVHAQTLLDDVAETAANPSVLGPSTNTTTYDPDHHVMVVTVAEPSSAPSHWGAYLGDILNNFRSSLDHVAWALVSAGDTPPNTLTENDARRVQFPIYEDEKRYDKSVGNKLPGVTDDQALDAIRAFQPFPGSATAQAIGVLHGLNNHDKHRTVQPTLLYPSSAAYEVTSQHDCTIVEDVSTETAVPFKRGAVLCTIKVAETGPEPSLTVNVSGTFAVGLPDNTSLELWIEATAKLIAGLILKFGFPPDEVGHLLNPYMTRRYTDEPGTPPWLPGFAP